MVGECGYAMICAVKPDWTDVYHIMSSIQAGFAVLALIAAGLWAFSKWYAERRPSLHMTVTARQDVEASTDTEFIVRGEIEVTNHGNAPTVLNLGDGPIFVAKVKSILHGTFPDPEKHDVEQGKIQFGPSKKFWVSRPLVDDKRRPDTETLNRISPEGKDTFHFMVKVYEPGTYGILFSVKTEGRPSRALKGKAPYPARWEPPMIFVDVKPAVKALSGEESPTKALSTASGGK